MSTTTPTPAMNPTCENGGEYCAAHGSLNAPDLFIVCWTSVLLMFTTLFYYWISISSPISSSQKITKTLWRLGFCTCTFIYFRELTYVIAWFFWIFTFDYSETSGCFILHYTSHGLWVFSGTLLYLFYIYRLYLVYNKTDNFFGIKKCNYIVLIILNVMYFVSLSMVFASWKWYNAFRYAMFQVACLILEVTMAIIISTLLVTPFFQTDKNVSIQKSRPILKVFTKLTVLSIISLGTTAVLRIFLMITFLICGEEECWVMFMSYALWSVDSASNIFCILCSFKTGDKYYDKYCNLLHQYVISKWNNDRKNKNSSNNNDFEIVDYDRTSTVSPVSTTNISS